VLEKASVKVRGNHQMTFSSILSKRYIFIKKRIWVLILNEKKCILNKVIHEINLSNGVNTDSVHHIPPQTIKKVKKG